MELRLKMSQHNNSILIFTTTVIVIILHLSSVSCLQEIHSPNSPAKNLNIHEPHPLDSLTATEIQRTSQIIRNHFRGIPIVFSTVTLKEPKKAELIEYFLRDLQPPPNISRRSFALVIDPVEARTFEVIVNIHRNLVESVVKVAQGLQPMFCIDEADDITDTVLKDLRVQRRLGDLGIRNLSSVLAGFWDLGYAGDRPQYLGKRISQVYFTISSFPGDNHYAHPLGFIVIVDILQKRVLDIEELPIHDGFDVRNRQGDFAPLAPHNYDPTVLPANFFRTGVNPINFSQPGGPSYKVTGSLVEWQNFKLRVGYNDREGLVLHNINYNDKGQIRPLIYRAALSELVVPYGDARPPFHRKMAFDAGQYGIGSSAHSLQSPADCKGSVKFFDVVVSNKAGLPVTIQQAICLYEDDVGSLLKKYDAHSGRSFVIRSQRLVLTFTATSGNYDYQFNWIFHQDASIKVEVQLNGIDNPNFVTTGSRPKHGTVLTPNINAQYHQHVFVMRIDMEIDGSNNSVATVDVVSEGPTGSASNPYGNGIKDIETILKTAGQARTKTSPSTARTWRIFGNLNSKNEVSNITKGYRLIAEHPINLMMNRDSPIHPKLAFVDNDVWVTPYHDEQIHAGGLYLNNSGLPEWVENNLDANVANTDIVLWHVFGCTHLPRAEDFPVMSTETIGFWLKPTNFFSENPAINLPSFLHIPRK